MNSFLFNGLSNNQIKRITDSLSEPVTVNHGEEMYRCSHIGLIASGNAKIIRKNELGISVTMRNISSGEFFGMASVFGDWNEDFSSIVAISKCKVIYISENELKMLFGEYPQISYNYIVYLTEKIRFLNKKIDTFSAGNTEEKLYEFLVSHSDENNCVTLPFGMAELARRLRVGRSSLYRSIEALEKNNLIQRDKKIFRIL
ncbi:MAG: Crp/Fnr family transcriptional regulator [Ruminococcus sp.]|nr:Crp/Fnr family transcriptional regulator [Candidatus Copronaster equi]